MPQKPSARRKPSGQNPAEETPQITSSASLPPPSPAEPISGGHEDRPATGRFTPEVGDRFCQKVATSKQSLRTICAMDGMPSVTTILRWLRERPDFREEYRIAKQEQAELMVEEILEIADDGSNDTRTDEKGREIVCTDVLQRSKLRVDARKWLASKLLPKKYGDKVEAAGARPEIHAGVTLTEAKRKELIARRRAALERIRNTTPGLS
jgi:hypothetical protein